MFPFRESNLRKNFGGVFKPNSQNPKKHASIPAKFCKKIKTTRCTSRVVKHAYNKSKIWWTAAILKTISRHISATVRPITTKFGKMTLLTHIYPVHPISAVKIGTFKTSRWRITAILKTDKSQYLGNGLTERHEIWHGYAH